MKITLNIFLILAVFTLQLHAQVDLSGGSEKKASYSLSTGTSFYSLRGHAHGSSFFLAPEVKLKLSPKFTVDAGIMLIQNRFNFNNPTSIFGEKSVVVKSAPEYNGIYYVSGSYTYNTKLSFNGSIVKSFTPDGSYSRDALSQRSFQMMSLGASYKLTNNITVGGNVRMIQTNGYNPYTGCSYVNPGLGFGPMNSFYGPTW